MTNFASLCVLSYNRPAFLQTMLQSLAENAEAPFELIIHDDGSDDPQVYEYLDLLEELGAVSTVIRNRRGHNQGQGIALNRMFGMAKGDPIIKLDQDLTFKPGWLKTVNGILDRNREAERGPMIGLLGLLHYYAEPVHSERTLIDTHEDWSRHSHILGSAFAMPRAAWEDLGPFSEHSDAFAEDWEMQKKVTDSVGYVCGLPLEDLCTNHGMGPGPSTVVKQDDQGKISVHKIHHGPFIFTSVE